MATALVSLGAAACAGGGGPGAVPRDVIARRISYLQQRGSQPDTVVCPENLPAQVGATVQCRLSGGSLTFRARTTSVGADGIQFDIAMQRTGSGASDWVLW